MYHAQVTLAQGPFSIRSVCTGWGLGFIAANLEAQATVMHYRTLGRFVAEVRKKRSGKLIPMGDNLAPFGPETYFDGREVRVQESTDSLHRSYFPQLGIHREDLWITDIVKVYLYPEKHLRNCRQLFPSSRFVETHHLFPEIAEASHDWFVKELEVCNPRLVITLGEVAARVVSRTTPKLDEIIRDLSSGKGIKVVHLAHPEIRRRNKVWDERTKVHLANLAKQVRKFL